MRHTLSNGNTGIKGKERALDIQVGQNSMDGDWTDASWTAANEKQRANRGRLPLVNALFNAHPHMMRGSMWSETVMTLEMCSVWLFSCEERF